MTLVRRARAGDVEAVRAVDPAAFGTGAEARPA